MASIAASVARHNEVLRGTTSGVAAGYDRAFAVAAITLLAGTALAALATRGARQARATRAQDEAERSQSLGAEKA